MLPGWYMRGYPMQALAALTFQTAPAGGRHRGGRSHAARLCCLQWCLHPSQEGSSGSIILANPGEVQWLDCPPAGLLLLLPGGLCQEADVLSVSHAKSEGGESGDMSSLHTNMAEDWDSMIYNADLKVMIYLTWPGAHEHPA